MYPTYEGIYKNMIAYNDHIPDNVMVDICHAMIEHKGNCAKAEKSLGIKFPCAKCHISDGDCDKEGVVKKARKYLNEHAQDQDNLI
jgi:cytochrome c